MTRQRQINVNQLYPRWLVGQEGGRPFHLIDVRSADEFNTGHIPGARLIPLDSLIQKGAEISRDEPVFLICRSGMRSAQALSILVDQFGHENLANIEGGTMAWIKAGYPIEKGGRDE